MCKARLSIEPAFRYLADREPLGELGKGFYGRSQIVQSQPCAQRICPSFHLRPQRQFSTSFPFWRNASRPIPEKQIRDSGKRDIVRLDPFSKVALAGAGGAAVFTAATVGVGLYQRNTQKESPALLGVGIGAGLSMALGISIGSSVAATDPVKGAAIFAAGLGSFMGFAMIGLPIAVAIGPKFPNA